MLSEVLAKMEGYKTVRTIEETSTVVWKGI